MAVVMRLHRMQASRYRSLFDFEFEVEALNLLIGANASGKSTILDGLQFLNEAVREKKFDDAIYRRGGLMHLAWKGEAASDVSLLTTYAVDGGELRWQVRLTKRNASQIELCERLEHHVAGETPRTLLDTKGGRGSWWSNGRKTDLAIEPMACALTAAAADESFEGRSVAAFVRNWGFFDPNTQSLRRASHGLEAPRLHSDGGNLAARLRALQQEAPERYKRILSATNAILGVPEQLEFRSSDTDDKVYFVQKEAGLNYRVHQIGASSGTLRVLALITALLGSTDATLVAIEEPENHIHPTAIDAFAQLLEQASREVQVLVTTHSPQLLDCLDSPESVCVVRRGKDGTVIDRLLHADRIRKALDESGFGLGEYFQTQGFGV